MAADSRYARARAWLDHRLIRPLYTARVRRPILPSFPFWVASLLTGLVGRVLLGLERVGMVTRPKQKTAC